MSNSPSFVHDNPKIGSLVIDNGLDQCSWAYNLNTAVYPTYGGEVVQILSVYIDDVTIGGTVSTYSQAEAIYSYFANYMQLATQGFGSTAAPNQAYIAIPMTFTYPARQWSFSIYPKSAPGFSYSFDTVAPTWQVTAHVEDDNVNLIPIKNAIQSAVTNQLNLQSFQGLNDEISPDSGDPDTDPFQTYTGNASTGLQNAATYYNSLISAYSSGNFSSLTGGVASGPTGTPSATPATQSATSSSAQSIDNAKVKALLE